MNTSTRLVREATRMLKAAGLEHELESGRAHIKVRVEGRQVAVLSRGRTRDRCDPLRVIKSMCRRKEQANG